MIRTPHALHFTPHASHLTLHASRTHALPFTLHAHEPDRRDMSNVETRPLILRDQTPNFNISEKAFSG